MTAAAPGGRLVALDAFRGATIAAMILVNNPGSWRAVPAPLRHAAWHGWTPADLVFPFFLFIAGVAIPLSLTRRAAIGASRAQLLRRIGRRGLLLFALGLLLSAWPVLQFTPELALHENLRSVRIPGVLQRIAVCYVLASTAYLWLSARGLAVLTWVCLLGYWALLAFVPVPGVGPPRIDDPDATLVAWLDRALLGGHLWSQTKTWDPEGILSTIPALATTLFGLSAGRLLLGGGELITKIAQLFVRGSLLAAAGYAMAWLLPINKPLWTSSYALFTAGLATGTLALFLWCADLRGRTRALEPLVVYGVNALAVFVLSGLAAKTLGLIPAGERASLRVWLYAELYASWLPPYVASLGFALTWVLGWYVILRMLYARGIRITV